MTQRCNETKCFCQPSKAYPEWKREIHVVEEGHAEPLVGWTVPLKKEDTVTVSRIVPRFPVVPGEVHVFDGKEDVASWVGPVKVTPKVLVVDNSVLESWSVCEYKTYLRYLRNLVPGTTSDALSYGSAIHEAMAAYYRAGMNPGSDACIPILTDVLLCVHDTDAIERWFSTHSEHIVECKQCTSIASFLVTANAADSPL
ncbi:hypothetical protein LCGC14_2690810, partial [marine sediment metagenome]